MSNKSKGVDFKKLLAKAKVLNFAPIDAVKGGEEIGLMEGTKFEFKEKGDCLVGVLLEREYREKPYRSYAHTLENLEGKWFFWGSAVIDSRLKDVAIPALLKIECLGKKVPTGGGPSYFDIQIFEYPMPSNFDPRKHVVALDPSDNQLKFFDMPVRDEPQTETTEKGGE